MITSFYYLAFAVAVAFGAAVTAFAAWSGRTRKGMNILVLFVSAAIAAALYALTYGGGGYATYALFLSAAFAVMATMLCVLYKNRPIATIALALLLLCAAALSYQYIKIDIGMFGVGAIVGLIYRESLITRQREDRDMRKTKKEVDRDIMQIAIGIVVLLVMIVSGAYAYIVFALMIIGIAFCSHIASSGEGEIYNRLLKLERSGTEFGRGALHIAAGAAILIGFGATNVAMFGIAVLFFADALATIIGIRLYKSKRMPHNKRKSFAGTIAFFITAAIFGFVLIGIYGIIIALALAVIESIDFPVDDNIIVPIATLVLAGLIP